MQCNFKIESFENRENVLLPADHNIRSAHKISEQWQPNILVVDDEREVIKSVKKSLKRFCGMKNTFEAGNGREALSLLKEKQHTKEEIDILILDQNMPEISGLDLIKILNKAPIGILRVVMLSLSSDKQVYQELINLGRFINFQHTESSVFVTGFLEKELKQDESRNTFGEKFAEQIVGACGSITSQPAKYAQEKIIETDFRLVINNDWNLPEEQWQVISEYQPEFDVLTDQVYAAESLLRYKHPEFKFFPDQLVDLAERKLFVDQLGERTFYTACVQSSHWPENIRVSVNVSAIELLQENFIKRRLEILKDTNKKPGQIILEVTESAVVGQIRDLIPKLKTLADLGMEIAIDDFGSGMSSLGRVKELTKAINPKKLILKLDGIFAEEDIHENLQSRNRLNNIVQFAFDEGIRKVVIEKVEKESQLSVFQEIAKHYQYDDADFQLIAQGWVRNRKAMSSKNFLEFLNI